ncbi:MAG: lipolytic protein family [Prosthecobacter sp.]|nr:lipolytic protein family [Prosthecobacter sp.]
MRICSKAFLLFLGVLTGFELIARVFFVQTLSGRFDYGYAPTAGFVEHADGRVDLVRAGGRKFFPQSFSLHRPADTFRIMVIGDSVPRGKNVESSYAGQLGKLLNDSGIRTESLNLCLPGYGARRKQVVLEQALKYKPSLIILHVNGSNEYEDEREWKRHEEFQSSHPRNWLMKSVILRRLYELKNEKVFWELLPVEIRSQKAVNDADAEVSTSMNEDKLRAWDGLVHSSTEACVQMAGKAGVPMILIAQTSFVWSSGAAPFMMDQTFIQWFGRLESPHVACLSMKQILSRQNFATLFSDTSHLKPEGHSVMAQALRDLLQQRQWLPARP